jgi:hypothetical protein
MTTKRKAKPKERDTSRDVTLSLSVRHASNLIQCHGFASVHASRCFTDRHHEILGRLIPYVRVRIDVATDGVVSLCGDRDAWGVVLDWLEIAGRHCPEHGPAFRSIAGAIVPPLMTAIFRMEAGQREEAECPE